MECLVKSWVPAAHRVSWRETHPLPGAVSAIISKHWCERRTEMHGQLWTAMSCWPLRGRAQYRPHLSACGVQICDAGRVAGGRLRAERPIESVECYPEAGPFGAPCGQLERQEVLPIAFMDDIHAFSSHGSAEQAVRALAKTAELYSQVLESHGSLINWKPGKTELEDGVRSSDGCCRREAPRVSCGGYAEGARGVDTNAPGEANPQGGLGSDGAHP